MLFQPSMNSNSLGADIRALRKSRGLTLVSVAHTLGRSVGWISQVERDLSHPTIDDLREIGQVLGVPLSLFFGQSETAVEEQGYVVRKESRRRIGSRENGLVEEMLSPDLTDDFEVVYSRFEAGSKMDSPKVRQTQEVGYLLNGRLDMMIGGRNFTIEEGDSFRIRGEAYSWANPYDETAIAIWVIAPPVY